MWSHSLTKLTPQSGKMSAVTYDNNLSRYLPTLGVSFDKIKKGTTSEIDRPSFKAVAEPISASIPRFQEILVPRSDPIKIPNVDRRGIGNYEIQRINFLQDAPKARELIDFEKLEKQQEREEGVKIRFGDKTFEQMFQIKEADPSDLQWLNEKRRLLATGLTEDQLQIRKPLGREQRTINKKINLAEASQNLTQSVGDKLSVIQTALTQNRLETKQDIDAVSQEIVKLLSNVADINKISATEFVKLKQVIDRIKLPKTLKEAGFTHRLWDKAEYTAQSGVINAYIISRTDMANLQTPLAVLRTGKNPAQWSLSSLITTWPVGNSKKNGDNPTFPALYLDLENNVVISQDQAFDLVSAGVDNGILSGTPFQQSGVPKAPLLVQPSIGANMGDVARSYPQNPPAMMSDFDIDSLTQKRLMKYGRALSRYHGFANLRTYVKDKYALDETQTDSLLNDINLTRAEVKALNYVE
jgi:uncharacterized protein YnzC (UPF0291/DUF896 family)